MARAQLALLIITLLLLFLGLAALITGLVGDFWYVDTRKPSTYSGLIKYCYLNVQEEQICINRDKFLTFQKVDFSKDMIFLGLSVSSLFALLGSLTATRMFCCQRAESSWRCNASLTSILTSCAGAFAISAVAYNEYWGQKYYNENYIHGWSVLVAWAGAGELFLGTIFAYMLMCISPSHGNIVNGQNVYESHGDGNEGYDSQGVGNERFELS